MLSQLAYERKGSGEPLVLLHGIGHRRQAWDPIFERLAEDYDVIAVDLAGFGASAPYSKSVPYSMDAACRNLAGNFKEWGIDRPHVVGNSLGGAIALELGARGQARSVTALSPGGFFGVFDRLRAFAMLLVLRLGSLLPPGLLKMIAGTAMGRYLIGFPLYAHPERFTATQVYGDALALKGAKAFERTIQVATTYSFSSAVDVPTTIAWGTRDRMLPYAQSGIAHERLPSARHVALPNCGHVPMSDDPALVVRTIQLTAQAA